MSDKLPNLDPMHSTALGYMVLEEGKILAVSIIESF